MMGVPCITTDYPGADEVIDNGITGMIIPRQDPHALATTLLKLVKAPELADTMSSHAMEEAVRYQTENVINQWRVVVEA